MTNPNVHAANTQRTPSTTGYGALLGLPTPHAGYPVRNIDQLIGPEPALMPQKTDFSVKVAHLQHQQDQAEAATRNQGDTSHERVVVPGNVRLNAVLGWAGLRGHTDHEFATLLQELAMYIPEQNNQK